VWLQTLNAIQKFRVFSSPKQRAWKFGIDWGPNSGNNVLAVNTNGSRHDFDSMVAPLGSQFFPSVKGTNKSISTLPSLVQIHWRDPEPYTPAQHSFTPFRILIFLDGLGISIIVNWSTILQQLEPCSLIEAFREITFLERMWNCNSLYPFLYNTVMWAWD